MAAGYEFAFQVYTVALPEFGIQVYVPICLVAHVKLISWYVGLAFASPFAIALEISDATASCARLSVKYRFDDPSSISSVSSALIAEEISPATAA